jgi:hypothetical protein
MLMQEHPLPQNTPGDYDLCFPNSQEQIDPNELATYIAQMSGELAMMARNARLEVIAYFLEMVRHEAQKTARGRRPITEIPASGA